MDDETPPEAEHPPDTGESLREGVEVAERILGAVTSTAEQVQSFTSGGGEPPSVPGVLGGIGSGLSQSGAQLGSIREIPAEVSQALSGLGALATLGGGLMEATSALVEGIEALEAQAGRIEEVELAFACADAPPLRAVELHVEEELAGPTLASVTVFREEVTFDPTTLLGRSATLTWSRAGLVRKMGGIVRAVTAGRRNERAVLATLEVVPAVELASEGRDSRIFQDLDVPSIVEEVLSPTLESFGRSLESRLTRAYAVREYTTQREESDWAFAQRLLEDEGIAWRFVTGDDGIEVLVLVDDNASFEAVRTLGDGHVRYIASENVFDHVEPVRTLARRKRLRANSMSVVDHDWTQPAPRVEAQASVEGGCPADHYLPIAPARLVGFADGRYERTTVARVASDRAQLIARDRLRFEGSSALSMLVPGALVRVSGAPVAGFEGTMLVTRVTHRARDGSLAHVLGEGVEAEPYRNDFEAIPSDAPFRPDRRHERPRVPAMESALVVGPDDSVIHTDAHRRVRVQFRWDRQGVEDERSSCFLRVMQAWAGPGFGVDFLPRVGMEVVVSYLAGDPDRPFVAGCLYNASNPPPHREPGDDARSVLRTRSTSGSQRGDTNVDGYNELIFEDQAGAEEIALHASRDLNETVTRHHTSHVGGSETLSVAGSQRETVRRDQTLTVRGDRTKSVEGMETTTVQRDRVTSVGLGEALAVGADRTITVGGSEEHVVDLSRTVRVGHDWLESTSGRRGSTTTGEHTIVSDAAVELQSGEDAVRIEPGGIVVRSPASIRLVVGSTAVELSESGIVLRAQSIALEAPRASVVVSSGSVTTQATQVRLAGPGSTSVDLGATGVTVGGATISINADGPCAVQGTPIQLN